jgi:hypothetical protein
MIARAMAILVAAATVVAGVYAVVGYHFPPDQKSDASGNQAKPALTNAGPNLPTNVQQTTKGNNSPNIISGGNVNINIEGRK